MSSSEILGLPSTVAVFLTSIVCWYLLTSIFKNRKKSQEPQYYEPESFWKGIYATFLGMKWYWDPSPGKKSLVDYLYTEARTMGDLFPMGRAKFFKILNVRLLITDDSDSIKQLLCSNECSVKLPTTLADIISNGHRRGLLWNDGPTWKELRKYSVKKLGQLGFGKNDKLSMILSDLLPDLLKSIDSLKQSTNNEIPVKNLFILPVINVVWCIIGGYKFTVNDEKFSTLHKNVDTMTNLPLWKCHLINFLPRNEFIDNFLGYTPFYDSIKNVNEYIKEFVECKIKSRTGQLEPEDFVDHFLVEIDKHKDNTNLNKIYCKEQLIAILVDLFAAGMDTTSKFLEFSLMYMVLNPKIQKKVQCEIDSVLGKDNPPSYSDHRKCMPYTVATIMEIHRMASIVPIITRHIPNDWCHRGKILEKGTQTASVMTVLRRDNEYWGDADVFRPERFLKEDNTFITEKMNAVMPFGAGMRICPGESVSSATSFTLFAGILQKYTIRKGIENEMLAEDKNFGLVTQTLPFHVSLYDR